MKYRQFCQKKVVFFSFLAKKKKKRICTLEANCREALPFHKGPVYLKPNRNSQTDTHIRKLAERVRQVNKIYLNLW